MVIKKYNKIKNMSILKPKAKLFIQNKSLDGHQKRIDKKEKRQNVFV
jgi:hypothetical protein